MCKSEENHSFRRRVYLTYMFRVDIQYSAYKPLTVFCAWLITNFLEQILIAELPKPVVMSNEFIWENWNL